MGQIFYKVAKHVFFSTPPPSSFRRFLFKDLFTCLDVVKEPGLVGDVPLGDPVPHHQLVRGGGRVNLG